MKVLVDGKLRHSSKLHELVELVKSAFGCDINSVWTQVPPDADDDREYELLVEVSERSIEELRSGEGRTGGTPA